jgi:predicted Zn finger-like uncharacterized protein
MTSDYARAAMFTVCPKCALTLLVTAGDLRVAQGYVRCGRCSSVFNALARLSDERQAAGGEAATPAPPDPEPAGAPGEHADLSPLEEALVPRDEGTTPELPPTADEPVSEDALEFDPETTDVGAVFVQPPPSPQWTAATGSFKAMRAASQESTPKASTTSQADDGQLDVEIDANFLAEMLREPIPSEAQRPASESLASQPPPGAPAPEPPRAAPPPQHRGPPPRAAPPSAQPATRANPESTPEHGQATAGAATRRAALPGAKPRPAARHAAPHTRPPVEASARLPPAAAPGPEPPAREEPAPQATEEPTAVALGLDTEEATAPKKTADRFRLAREHPRVWGAGAVLGLVILTAQIVNHYRDDLAASPRFGRTMTAFYASLGVQLAPRWDLHAYDVRQLGASADPAGSGLITVRASIKNAGRQPQPLPLLRVTLQDRFGNRIAARDVAPRFYVPRSMPESSYLAGGQRIDAEMGFVDPGANAVGFEIDACLPASGGGIACANDLAAH